MSQEVLEDTQAGNKLIAEFMGGGFMENNIACMYPEGLPYWAKRIYDFDTMKVGGYEYHTSWDWLIPVVQKIKATDTGTLDVYSLYVEDSLRTANINDVYSAVIDFIKNYNQTQKK